MTALSDMAAAGTRILGLLTVSEAAQQLPGRCSVKRVRRLVKEGELTMVKLGSLSRITPESLLAYKRRLVAAAEAAGQAS